MYMQIKMPLACLVILTYTLLLYGLKRRLQTLTSRVFQWIGVAGVIHVLAAVVTEYTVNNRNQVSFLFNHIWHIIFLVSLSFVCALMYLYVLLYVERSSGTSRHGAKICLFVVLAFSILGELILPIDYIDTPMGSYSLGPKGYSLYLIVVYSMVMQVYTVIRYCRLLSLEKSSVLLASAAIFAIIASIQIAFPYILLTGLGITLIVISIAVSSEDVHMFINEQGLYNEQGCRKLLQEAVAVGKPFRVGMYAFLGQDEAILEAMRSIQAVLPEGKAKVICGAPAENLLIVVPLRSGSNVYPLPELPLLSDAEDITVCQKIVSVDAQGTVEDVLRSAREFRTRFEEDSLQRDELTGLLRRAAFIRQADFLLKAGHPFTFLMIDVDNFKQVNDQYGHSVGDELLAMVAQTLQQELRSTDVVCRMGGDEFGVLLQGLTEPSIITRITDQLRTWVGMIHLEDAPDFRVTLSIGAKISRSQDRSRSFRDIYSQADMALYRAKNAGKDRITISDCS